MARHDLKNVAVVGSLCIIGVINFAPIIGIGSPNTLAKLYGIAPPTGDLLILMRHRALLFGLVGGLLIAAAFRSEFQTIAITAGLISMLGFIALAWWTGSPNAELTRIVYIDAWASIGLIVIAILRIWHAR